MPACNLDTGFESRFGNTGFQPQAHGTILFEMPEHLLSLSGRNFMLKYVLRDGMGPLGPVQRRKPQSGMLRNSLLRFRRMPVRNIERDEKACIGIDSQ